MTMENTSIEQPHIPLSIPCPPLVSNIPPRAYRTPHESSVFIPVPRPPTGARIPGERLDWSAVGLRNIEAYRDAAKHELLSDDLNRVGVRCRILTFYPGAE